MNKYICLNTFVLTSENKVKNIINILNSLVRVDINS